MSGITDGERLVQVDQLPTLCTSETNNATNKGNMKTRQRNLSSACEQSRYSTGTAGLRRGRRFLGPATGRARRAAASDR